MGAVLIEGPKWCGKTTTAEEQAQSIIYMDTPCYRESYIEAQISIRIYCWKEQLRGLLTNGKLPRNYGMLFASL